MFTLTSDLEKYDITLPEILDKADFTILYFYPKDNTPWCTIEAVDFSKNRKKFKSIGAQIVWVSKDSHDSHCKFMTKHKLWFDLISDSDLDLHKQFDVWWEKSMYGKKYLGTIRSTFLLNKKGEILHARRNISAVDHVENVLEICTQIINSK